MCLSIMQYLSNSMQCDVCGPKIQFLIKTNYVDRMLFKFSHFLVQIYPMVKLTIRNLRTYPLALIKKKTFCSHIYKKFSTQCDNGEHQKKKCFTNCQLFM